MQTGETPMLSHPRWGLGLGLLILLILPARSPGDSDKAKNQAPPQPLPLEEALVKARVNGKYEMLLRQIKVAADFNQHTDFHDLGSQNQANYAGFTDLPSGHWVYVYPYWYIW